ncbi:hypothetical protein LNP74_19745 [Klebsiella pneumoniae subsp. pneumoniae]|nr:hypothetical protein [Klebsiella pneumoniae subsp. pneumoniae]
MNQLINSHPDQHHEEKAKKTDDRAPEDILSLASLLRPAAARNVAELDKAYKYAAHRLAGNQEYWTLPPMYTASAKDELNEVPYVITHRGAPGATEKEVTMKGALGKRNCWRWCLYR